MSRFNSLSSDDQARFLTGGYALVPNLDPSSTAIASAILPTEQYRQSWVPARAEAAAARGQHVEVLLPTENPAHLGGGTSQTTASESAETEGTKQDDAPDAVDDTTEAQAASGKGEGDGTGADKSKERDRGGGGSKAGTGNGAGRGSATGTRARVGTGTGPGPALSGTGPADIDAISGGFGGVRGGQADGLVGGTPWSRGHATGGNGTSLEQGPLVGAGGNRGAGLGGSAGEVIGRGDSRGASDAPRQGTSTMGHDPREVPPPGADVRRATAWDVLNDVSATTNFSSREGSPTGDSGGVPGGGGWFGWKGRVAQIVVATLSIVNFALLITGLPELVVGIVSLLARLPAFLRALPRFLRNLPQFLRELPATFRRLGGGLRGAWNAIMRRLPWTQAAREEQARRAAQERFLELLPLRKRQLELAQDAGRPGKPNMVQGAGGVHIEQALGRTIKPGEDQAVDFVDDILGRISLKGLGRDRRHDRRRWGARGRR